MSLDIFGKEEALATFRASPDAAKVNFTVRYQSFQLYPDMAAEGEDKREWYTRTKYNGSAERMAMFESAMAGYGEPVGIKFDFGGTMASTLNAHRVIQYFQGGEDNPEMEAKYGPKTADKLINALYKMFFEEQQHPSSKETLLKACQEAGIEDAEAKKVVEDEREFLTDVKGHLRMTQANGIDAVPNVVIEGRRRDFTLEGAKEVEEYLKAFAAVAKESS